MTGPNGSGSLITVATCTLNQWALDFDGNVDRIAESCDQAKRAGATYRLGPELEVSGYGCEDHFLEADTFAHCWESLVELLVERKISDDGLLCDVGMPVLYGGIRYNCRVLCYERKILLVRPKVALADNGNYRESRYFTAYRRNPHQPREELLLPKLAQEALGQRTVPFGLGFVQTNDGVRLGCESCEELWTPQSTHIDLALRGVEIIGNGSGSHHELRKLDQRLELMMSATRKCGGIYLYANQRGCDGGRLYYDGGAIIVSNGKLLAQAPQFKIQDVQVITATVDLDDVRSYRASLPSFGIQAVHNTVQDHSSDVMIDCEQVHILLNEQEEDTNFPIITTPPRPLQFSTPEEECCLGPACWLWDYLRRSGAAGFLLPLSGGADSSSVATIVGAMCHLVYEAAQHDPQVAADVRRVCRKEDDDPTSPLWLPSSPQDIASSVLHTVFMGTEHSSANTTSRAKRLAQAIGSYHLAVPIDLMVQAVIKVFTLATGKTPRFESRGGTMAEDLALQNIQARLRMVTAYLFAQLLPWVRDRTGFLLVLGSANVDEGLRGYMTKYDCSSADLNPIGAISKGDLKRMLLWASTRYGELDHVLKEIAGAPPTAELRPQASSTEDGADGTATSSAEHSQLDEDEMGMTYDELGWFGRLRKLSRCGPVSMYRKLCVAWGTPSALDSSTPVLSPREIAQKVQRFFFYYSVNRHKMCTLTPSYHAEGYSPDDNRFDLRQFLYNTKWPRQFRIMNQMVEASEKQQERQKQGE
jgi:NAD+ synthase (glutamine-hydrolysing)